MIKIGLIGCAGLGKSAVASLLSRELKISYVDSKGITRPVLESHGYQYENGVYVEQFLSSRDLEYEIVQKRIEAESLKESFVTDRTTIECFCYSFFGLPTYTEEEFSMLEDVCRENARKYTHLFLVPFECGWFQENGVRTMSTHFQWLVDNTIRGVIKKWDLRVTEIPKTRNTVEKTAQYIINKIGLNF